MKKLMIILMCMTAMIPKAMAYDYSYLSFETSDGSVISMDVSSLKITISGTTLTVTNNSANQSFVLTNLSNMHFSSTDETTDAAGITSLDDSDSQEVEVYSLSGFVMGTFDSLNSAKSNLPKGIYVIKNNDKTYKITVK